MKLAEYRGEDALDLLADILEPASEILTDEEIRKAVEDNTVLIKVVRMALKNHKKAILEIMARVEGVPIDEYKPNFFTLPIQLMNLISMPEMQMLFTSQGQMSGNEPSGSATENTGVPEE